MEANKSMTFLSKGLTAFKMILMPCCSKIRFAISHDKKVFVFVPKALKS